MNEVTVKPGAFFVSIQYNKISKQYKVVPYQYHSEYFGPSKFGSTKPGVYTEVLVRSTIYGFDTLETKYFKSSKRASKYAERIVREGADFIKATLSQELVNESWTTKKVLTSDMLPAEYSLNVEQWRAISDLQKEMDEDD